MRIGILGAGVVGQTLGTKLAELGHDVVLGTRRPDALDDERGPDGSLRRWLERVGSRGRVASFAEAGAHGEVVLNATPGAVTIAALEAAGADNLAGKILIDVTNPLDFSVGFPPSLLVCNTDSLAEQIQRLYPRTRVVKTLNTVTAALMVDPAAVGGGDHALFISGDDPEARARVVAWLRDWFGWRDVVDLGDLTTARGTEMLLPLWTRLYGALGTAMFNLKVVR
ncbi:MAG: NAD(P)-binding domain-containing protein [Gemmatimonadetes bacterium]|nr:NAD(P)-binding domain-containing protein [Gemmatimonadota bacterium]NIQ52722.1 NAD(P)-binding domain-containing protein [Gemmatimonadota bacterium]NIU72862.1 NAD(P)-binding domain-containing protein [Gammaproteobacteria bacterium]NIX43226.1 NAD(P)-binding domain-containing protein [Gemmatimonadota bacterium]NIY07397.1 NAD(P)-binding domain-containing protein [Gemmatimonadota bacterium]